MNKLSGKISYILSGIIILLLTGILIIIGHDNLIVSKQMRELYLPVFKAINDSGKVFAQNVEVPILGSISRDALFSEVKLFNLIYMLFPSYTAYVLSYAVKMIIAIISVLLLAKTILKEKTKEYSLAIVLGGILLGLIPVEAYYSYAVCSIPMLLYLLIGAIKDKKIKCFVGLLIYPVFSEFYHLGIYLLIVLLIYIFVNLIISKRLNFKLFIAWFLLLAGYALTEYRFVRLLINKNALILDTIILPLKGIRSALEEILLLFTVILVSVVIYFGLTYLSKNENSIAFKNVVTVAGVMSVVFLIAPFDNNVIINSLTKDKAYTLKNYYAKDFFDEVKLDTNYKEQWIGTYDYPVPVLIYNNFRTLEGDVSIITKYIKAYYEKYNDMFVYVAPDDNNTCEVDVEEFKNYDGRWLLTSKPLTAYEDNGWVLLKVFNSEDVPYITYVYQTASRYKDMEHSNIPYEDRNDLTFSVDEANRIIDDMNALINEANEYKENNPKLSDEEIIEALNDESYRELYNQTIKLLDDATTLYAIDSIEYSKNIYNEDVLNEMDILYAEWLDTQDLVLKTIRESAKSPYYVTLVDIFGEARVKGFLDYEDMTEEQKEREIKLESLGKEYEAAYMEKYYFNYAGEEWTFDSLTEKADTLDDDDIIAIYQGLYGELSKVLGEIYKQIVQLNNEIAKEEGYDSYAEFAYEQIYGRDYSISDIKKVFKEIKKSVNYIYSMQESMDKFSEYDPGYICEDDRATYEMLYPYIESIDPELGESLRHLLDYNLFDLKPSDTKPNKGFSMSLDSYNDAYIFDSPFISSKDLFTYVHEFGHYNNYYYVNEEDFTSYANLDLMEIDSQGLEVLMASKYSEIFDESTGKYLEMSDIFSMADTIVVAAIVAEFEIYAYENPEATVDELSKQYLKIQNEYGRHYNEKMDRLYDWVDVPHIFTSPVYYVSYMTSALAALEIYELSYRDYDMAVEKYMEISTFNSSMPYRSACTYVGLDDIFEKGNLVKIVKNIYTIFNQKAG